MMLICQPGRSLNNNTPTPQALGVGNEYVQEKRLCDLLQDELTESVRQEEARRYDMIGSIKLPALLWCCAAENGQPCGLPEMKSYGVDLSLSLGHELARLAYFPHVPDTQSNGSF